MVRSYEALYIVSPERSDEEVTVIMEKYQKVAEEQGAEVESANRWDKRRLAYEINGQNEGIYVLMTFKGEPQVEAELNRLFKIADDVLRHLIVRLDEK